MCAGTNGDHSKAPKVALFSQFWGTYKTPSVLHFLDNGAGPDFSVPNIKVPVHCFHIENEKCPHVLGGLRAVGIRALRKILRGIHGAQCWGLAPQKCLLRFFVLFLLNPKYLLLL